MQAGIYKNYCPSEGGTDTRKATPRKPPHCVDHQLDASIVASPSIVIRAVPLRAVIFLAAVQRFEEMSEKLPILGEISREPAVDSKVPSDRGTRPGAASMIVDQLAQADVESDVGQLTIRRRVPFAVCVALLLVEHSVPTAEKRQMPAPIRKVRIFPFNVRLAQNNPGTPRCFVITKTQLLHGSKCAQKVIAAGYGAKPSVLGDVADIVLMNDLFEDQEIVRLDQRQSLGDFAAAWDFVHVGYQNHVAGLAARSHECDADGIPLMVLAHPAGRAGESRQVRHHVC